MNVLLLCEVFHILLLCVRETCSFKLYYMGVLFVLGAYNAVLATNDTSGLHVSIVHQ